MHSFLAACNLLLRMDWQDVCVLFRSRAFSYEALICDRVYLCVQANLCYVDIDHQTVQLPEELPSFPQRAEFVDELIELLAKHKVCAGQVERWVTFYNFLLKLIS